MIIDERFIFTISLALTALETSRCQVKWRKVKAHKWASLQIARASEQAGERKERWKAAAAATMK